ncbi:MAG: DUF1080 domain-containing protein [Cyclobacteriaceae bacterium]|nr:DUF1080 domain-containing protein [Cyclobacteriaceae bacterium]
MKKKLLFLMLMMSLLMTCQAPREEAAQFRSLFNGENLEGWETYIGVPDPSVELPVMEKDAEGNYLNPVGLNNDPLDVFTVVEEDGEPAIRASGQINGSLATREEFENYHYRMEVKWGALKWPEGSERLRNSGLLYHGTGDYGQGLGVWKKSHECQMMETMFGDSYRMGDTYCSITASRPGEDQRYVYDPAAGLVEFGEGKKGGKICSKNEMSEKPLGEWNVVEVICLGDTSLHVINGVVNMVNVDSHLEVNGNSIPLTKGNIQLQSEGAEVFFRKMEIRNITAIPEGYLDQP